MGKCSNALARQNVSRAEVSAHGTNSTWMLHRSPDSLVWELAKQRVRDRTTHRKHKELWHGMRVGMIGWNDRTVKGGASQERFDEQGPKPTFQDMGCMWSFSLGLARTSSFFLFEPLRHKLIPGSCPGLPACFTPSPVKSKEYIEARTFPENCGAEDTAGSLKLTPGEAKRLRGRRG